MTWLRSIWILLAAFLAFAIIITIVALASGSADGGNSAFGWVVLVAETVALSVVLLALQSRWFTTPPDSVPGAVMTGVFLRLAIAEVLFMTTFVLLYTDLGTTGPMLVVALLVSIVLVWMFAAPTRRRIESLQDQMERLGSLGDVARELAAPRSTTEHPLN